MASDVYSELLTKLNYFGSAHLRPVMQKLVTPEEGRLLMELPAEPAELAEKLGWDEESVSSQLAELRQRGLVVDTRKGPQFLRSVPQLHDITTCSAGEWVDTELLDLWKEFYGVDQEKAIGLADETAVNPDNCYGCGVCAVGCSVGTITMRWVREQETVPI